MKLIISELGGKRTAIVAANVNGIIEDGADTLIYVGGSDKPWRSDEKFDRIMAKLEACLADSPVKNDFQWRSIK